jgi:hypothetical protein
VLLLVVPSDALISIGSPCRKSWKQPISDGIPYWFQRINEVVKVHCVYAFPRHGDGARQRGLFHLCQFRSYEHCMELVALTLFHPVLRNIGTLDTNRYFYRRTHKQFYHSHLVLLDSMILKLILLNKH